MNGSDNSSTFNKTGTNNQPPTLIDDTNDNSNIITEYYDSNVQLVTTTAINTISTSSIAIPDPTTTTTTVKNNSENIIYTSCITTATATGSYSYISTITGCGNFNIDNNKIKNNNSDIISINIVDNNNSSSNFGGGNSDVVVVNTSSSSSSSSNKIKENLININVTEGASTIISGTTAATITGGTITLCHRFQTQSSTTSDLQQSTSATVDTVATSSGGLILNSRQGSVDGAMQRCGLCSILSRLLRRAMCVGSRRGSGESYYQELPETVVSATLYL
ncbi:probable serine/threonine-protein kinase DDB_G0272254 isoform X2 [Condylostylus longicornis]|uniref:probable serine/threonine-protein kinase DDB_G0272254 isoform X2 n=1 Tax=Condylostylus longicornis TaxID=2530218 RepID=UPI00244E1359|nr:probable serine/threonine-protein kinase DDB_G0272254 isoform X2 [Condylostylus longicornis]